VIAALQVFLQTSSQLYAPTPAPNLIHLLFKAFGVLRFPLPCSATLTPLPATHPQNPPVTPFAATHANSPSCKSFPCHTYKKQGGVPCAARPVAQVGVRVALRLFSIQLRITSLRQAFPCITTSHQELLKWIPPSSPAPETPSTPPNSANSLSPTVASAACSVTSPTPPSASSTPAKSSNSSPRKKSARNSNPSPANSAPPPTSTTCSANSSISSPTAAFPPAAPKTSPISLSCFSTAKNISVTKPIWPTKTWVHGKKPSVPPTPRPNPKTNKKPNPKRKPS